MRRSAGRRQQAHRERGRSVHHPAVRSDGPRGRSPGREHARGAVAPCIGLDGDGGAGGDPGPGGLTASLPVHPVPTRLHAGRIRAAWRSRSRLRRQAPVTWRPVRQPQLPPTGRLRWTGASAALRIAIECQGRPGSQGSLGSCRGTEGPGVWGRTPLPGPRPVPDAAGEGCEEMGVSYYGTLLPVREPGAGLAERGGRCPASLPGARVSLRACGPDRCGLRF